MNSNLTDTLVVQKICALFITFFAFFYLDGGTNFMLLAIVLGHSHFLLAYIYKISARKIRLKNFLIFVALSTAIFLYFYRIEFPDFRLETLLFVASIYLIYHHVADDQFTLNFFSPKYSKIQRFQILSLITALSGLQLKWQFNPSYSWVFILLSFLFCLVILKEKLWEKLSWNNTDLFFGFEYIATILLFFSNITFSSSHFFIITFLGTAHYLSYYFHYYLKVKSIEPKTENFLFKRSGYFLLVFLTNALIMALFFYHRVSPNQYLGHFFSYNLFLVITLMHFISSTRTYEIPSLLGFKKN